MGLSLGPSTMVIVCGCDNGCLLIPLVICLICIGVGFEVITLRATAAALFAGHAKTKFPWSCIHIKHCKFMEPHLSFVWRAACVVILNDLVIDSNMVDMLLVCLTNSPPCLEVVAKTTHVSHQF